MLQRRFRITERRRNDFRYGDRVTVFTEWHRLNDPSQRCSAGQADASVTIRSPILTPAQKVSRI
jgi:hypothetical protein